MATQPQLNISPPDPFPFSRPIEWSKWKRRFERYRMASGLHKKKNEEQVNALIYLMGDQADDIFLSFSLAKDEKKDYDIVLEKFEKHFIPKRNIIYERAKFNSRTQQEGESIEEFITCLYSLAEFCEYGNLHEEMIRDRIVVGVGDRKLSEKLQLNTALTLEKAITLSRTYDSVMQQQTDLRGDSNQDVARVVNKKKFQKPKAQKSQSPKPGNSSNKPVGKKAKC